MNGGLVALPGEHRPHGRSVGIILVHGRQAEQHFHGVDHVYRGVEAVVDVGLSGGARGILADYERDRSMGVDMIAAVLRVVFQNEDGGVLPIRAVGDGVDDAAQRQIVVRH